MQTVIVTGATGFIGKALTLSLLQDGYEVYGIGRNKDALDDLNINPHFHSLVLEFYEYEKIAECLNGVPVEMFFHTSYDGVSGERKKDYLVQINNLKTACITVNQACRLGCRRYVCIGSVDEFAAAKYPDEPFAIPTHSTIYSSIKLSLETIGKAIAYNEKMDYVTALLALTYGNGNKANILPNVIIRNLINNESIKLISGDSLFDMIHISEAIGGIRAVASRGKSFESYYVGHEKIRTLKEVVDEIVTVVGGKSRLLWNSYPGEPVVVDYNNIHLQKLYKDTGYRCDEKNNAINISSTMQWLMHL